MGCQVDTKHDAIGYSTGSWLVVEMCSLWYDEQRDSDGERHQVRIDSTSVHAANDETPRTYKEYLVYRCEKGLGPWVDRHGMFTEEDFLTARTFIADTAKHNCDIWVSH
jgi:hypothetical protein